MSFNIIFTEIIEKEINEKDVFKYTAQRLREIGVTLKTNVPEEEEIKEEGKGGKDEKGKGSKEGKGKGDEDEDAEKTS